MFCVIAWFPCRFNPRAREGRDSRPYTAVWQLLLFQSTRPRGARHQPIVVDAEGVIIVSIHAPARGATHNALRRRDEANVSIHAPARGATRPKQEKEKCYGVSIHAPARGATSKMRMLCSRSSVSIHAPARGATRRRAGVGRASAFQSTRPRGARRHCRRGYRKRKVCFNPRAREGRDGVYFLCVAFKDLIRFNPRAREGRDRQARE